jgi:aryl-alcohol dehydrogenase-like predicted oxidoreductase
MNTVKLADKETTIMGLGGGGFSRLGMRAGDSARAGALNVVKTAYDQGIRFFDSAEAYGTEEIFGEALAPFPREEYTLCSKLSCHIEGILKTPEQVRESLERTLKNFKTDYVDIYYTHGITPEAYPRVVENILPVLNEAKKEGLIRMVGISEMFGQDQSHKMMTRAVKDGFWDAVMVGYNMMNQSASDLLKKAGSKGIARVNMFAVRQALINNEVFGIYIDRLINEGKFSALPIRIFTSSSMICSVHGDSVSLPNLAYQFVRDEGLFDIILSGYREIEHLKDNVAALEGPVLSERVRDLVREFFAGECGTSGQEGF